MSPKSRFLFSHQTYLSVGIFFLVFILVLVLIIGQGGRSAEAQIVNFYSGTCLGGWGNPDGAVGEPEVLSASDSYSKDNSAVYNDNAASIYCGGYEGTLPPETKHTQVTLRFSWSQDQEAFIPPTPVAEPEPTETPSNASSTEDMASSTENGVDIEEIKSNDPIPEELDISPPLEETTPPEPELVPEPEPVEPSPEPAAESPVEVSLLDFLFPAVHAQEASSSEVFVEQIAAPADAQFEVQYTLDGEQWNTLAYVTEVQNDVALIFPSEVFSGAEDISRVQIAVRPLLRIEKAPVTYLDAMWLEVSYAPIVALGISETITHVPSQYSFDAVEFISGSSTASTTASNASSTAIVGGSIKHVYGIDSRYILVHTNVAVDYYELWLFDLKQQIASKIADSLITIGKHQGGVKEGLIFWYDGKKERIYTYDIKTAGTYHELWLVSNLPENDEPLSFSFPFTQWRLIDGEEQFVFSSPETGEVFSDGSNEGLESFVRQFNLDNLLSSDQLQEVGVVGI